MSEAYRQIAALSQPRCRALKKPQRHGGPGFSGSFTGEPVMGRDTRHSPLPRDELENINSSYKEGAGARPAPLASPGPKVSGVTYRASGHG
jgi:hypothetical protein